MSEQTLQEPFEPQRVDDEGVNDHAAAVTAVSLEERMAIAEKAKTLASSEKSPIPGWASFCWVELKVINNDAQQAAIDKCERIRPARLQNLYIAAETLLTATAGFWEVKGDEQYEPYETSWSKIAAVVHGMKESAPREAIIRVVGNEDRLTFYGGYLQGLGTAREAV